MKTVELSEKTHKLLKDYSDKNGRKIKFVIDEIIVNFVEQEKEKWKKENLDQLLIKNFKRD